MDRPVSNGDMDVDACCTGGHGHGHQPPSTTNPQRGGPSPWSVYPRRLAGGHRQSSWSASGNLSGREPSERSGSRPTGERKPDGWLSRPPSLQKRDSVQSVRTNNAEKWFDDSNKNVRDDHGSDYMDDEPPFYLAERPLQGIPPRPFAHVPDVPSKPGHGDPLSDGLGFRPSMRELSLNGDSSEDYRSVIDDLTVENQRLRQRLKKYRTLDSSHLQKEKLFEVTFHGLSPEKRWELENTLREFVSGLEESSPNTGASFGLTRPPLQSDKMPSNSRSSARLSESRPTDSGYGSISTSGVPSIVQSSEVHRPSGGAGQGHKSDRQFYRANFAQRPASEKAVLLEQRQDMKKKMIVRRLEQLFTGKVLHWGLSHHSMGLRDHSGPTADADRLAIDMKHAALDAEGIREARILPAGLNYPRDVEADPDGAESNMASGDPSPLSTASSSEQRPTQLLDLDLRRTQHPAENIDYIRHLGISTPSVDRAVDSEPTDGWVYLNLLANMAQLHTVNVTPEFIRQAVSELSRKLELSEDGRKIRWKGGSRSTKLSSDSGSLADLDSTSSPDEASRDPVRLSAPRKRNLGDFVSGQGLSPAAEDGATRVTSRSKADPARLRANTYDDAMATYQSNLGKRFHYKPLFFRRTPTDEDHSDNPYAADSSESSSAESTDQTKLNALSHAATASIHRPLKRRKREPRGPLVFYKKVKFCTDLSGDRVGKLRHRRDTFSYAPLTREVIGCASPVGSELSSSSGSWTRSPSLRSLAPISEREEDVLDMNEPPMSVGLEPILAPTLESPATFGLPLPPPFEVSGIAGVHPADHFLVNVQILRRICGKLPQVAASGGAFRLGTGTPQLQAGQDGAAYDRLPVKDEILSATRIDLPPSTLPPPSCVLPAASPSLSEDGRQSSTAASDSDASEDDDDDNDNLDLDAYHAHHDIDLSHPPPPPQLTRMFSTISSPGVVTHPSASSSEPLSSSSSSSSASSSIDLLAFSSMRRLESSSKNQTLSTGVRELESGSSKEGEISARGTRPGMHAG